MAPTQVKATAEHPASIQKQRRTRGLHEPERHKRPQKKRGGGRQAIQAEPAAPRLGRPPPETVAVADDQKEARPTACTQRTKKHLPELGTAGNRMPPSTNDARPTSMTGFVPHRSAAGPEGEAQEDCRGQIHAALKPRFPPTSLPRPPRKRGQRHEDIVVAVSEEGGEKQLSKLPAHSPLLLLGAGQSRRGAAHR